MKKFTTALLVLSLALGRQGIAQDSSFHPKFSTVLPGVIGKPLMKPCSRLGVKSFKKLGILDSSSVQVLEQHFRRLERLPGFSTAIKDLGLFAYQYVGLRIKKTRYIYINAFPVTALNHPGFAEWKTEPVRVCDGGRSFWGVLFNLETQSFEQLYFNGALFGYDKE